VERSLWSSIDGGSKVYASLSFIYLFLTAIFVGRGRASLSFIYLFLTVIFVGSIQTLAIHNQYASIANIDTVKPVNSSPAK
jgi:hypothetical protein